MKSKILTVEQTIAKLEGKLQVYQSCMDYHTQLPESDFSGKFRLMYVRAIEECRDMINGIKTKGLWFRG